ncbi:hypothetical protein GGR53DRAFT_89129 [Hypoxylon sp. FL1150]|nr:hypothetical protein GGR53DRAFT_89129 [Hypoxylon sp. FL1150]
MHQDLSYSSSTSAPLPFSEDFSAQQLHILRQAASVLDCDIDELLALHHRSPYLQQYQASPSIHSVSSKRQRLSTDMASASPEKSSPPALSAQDAPEHSRAPESASGFIQGSRLVQYLSNIPFCAPCTTCEPQVYAPVPATSPYTYAPTRQYFDDRPSSPGSVPGTMPSGQPNVFASSAPSTAPPVMPNYPLLQPSRPMTVQPTTSGEGMMYPEALAAQQYFSQPELHHGLPIPVSSHGMDPQTYGPSTLRQSSANEGVFPQQVNRTPLVTKQPRELDIVQPHQRPPAARRGPFKSNDDRQKTAETRRIGSCIRCRMQRIRCETNPMDKQGACLTCLNLKPTNMKLWKMPCLRYKITDVKLFKPGNVKGYEWTRRWVEGIPDDISNWASTETRRVRVTEGYTDQTVELRVRRFIPLEGDRLDRSWVHNGAQKRVTIPPYAIVNLEEAKRTYDNYIKQSLPECCKKVLTGKDKLLLMTYATAIKMTNDASTDPKQAALMRKALQLWMAIRLTTKSTIIVGDETLGMSRDIMDETSPLSGCIPLPPVMGAQIELILIHQIQAGLRREMLETLQSMTHANQKKTWFTTYIITFILLHNVALLCQHDAGYARKHGIQLQSRFARVEMVREYQTGANILLGYFHYINKGTYPFSAECKDKDLKAIEGLDGSKLRAIKFTKDTAEKYKEHWDDIRRSGDYENDFYYISQLYEENWTPLSTI